jgi:hypothetical protein
MRSVTISPRCLRKRLQPHSNLSTNLLVCFFVITLLLEAGAHSVIQAESCSKKGTLLRCNGEEMKLLSRRTWVLIELIDKWQ